MTRFCISILFAILFSNLSAQSRSITRGSTSGEIYISNPWFGIINPILGLPFYDTVRFSVCRISENGKKLTIQYDADYFANYENTIQPANVIADATEGVVYNKQYYSKNNYTHTSLWVSFDYGKNWEFREENTGLINYLSGVQNGVIYKGKNGIMKSSNYGESFYFYFSTPSHYISKQGYGDCEFLGIMKTTSPIYNFHFTNECANTFIVTPIDNDYVFGSMSGLFPDVYRGGVPGEVYVDSWFPGYNYKVSFSDDYGESFRNVYLCDDCYNNNGYYLGLRTFFMSDRESGVFYIVKYQETETVNPWGWYFQICVEHYRDYGDSLVGIYCHDLTKDYGSVCEPAAGLKVLQHEDGNVLIAWKDESSLPVDSFLVYRNNELINSISGNENFYLDENLPDGVYEYYVVAYYVTGCVSDISNIVIVTFEFCENVKDLSTEVIDNKNIMLNWSIPENINIVEGYNVFRNSELVNSELVNETSYLDENLGAGNYEYYVVAHYTNGCVSDISNIVTITITEESYQITFEVKDINTLPIFEALILINNEDLLTDNQGIAAVSLFDGNYFYNVSKTGYIDIDSVLTVSGAPQTIFLEMESEAGVNQLGIGNYELRVYPNPTRGELFVEIAGDPESSSGRRSALPFGSAKNDIKNIEMFDVFGRNVGVQFSPSFGGGRGEVSFGGGLVEVSFGEVRGEVSHLSSGIYFVRIVTEKGVVIKKVVKQ